jgi:transposase
MSPTSGTSLSAQYHRLARRLGKKKAVVAVSHSVLVIISQLLRTKKPSTDLGADSFAQLEKTRLERHHVHRLEHLGSTVTLTPKEVAEPFLILEIYLRRKRHDAVRQR